MAMLQRLALADGTPRWKAVIRRKGSPKLSRTFRTRAQAEAWAKRVEVQILDGRLPQSRSAAKRTVDDLLSEYAKHVLPRFNRKGQQKRWTHLRWWSRRLGPVKLSRVRRRMVSEALRALERGETPSGRPASPATCNRYLATLRHAFSYGLTELEWIHSNPASRMRKREPRGRVRFLDDSERAALLEACRASEDPRLYPLVLLALSTGARQGELMSLRWKDVDLNRQVAVVHHTKNRERRALPLVDAALAEMRRMAESRPPESEYVFAGRRGHPYFPKARWNAALTQAGIEDFRFHDLRHTAASYLAMSGATLAEIAEILGHKTLVMVKRYAHLTDQHTTGVVARMSRKYLPAS